MIAIIISVILFVATIALAVLGVVNKTKPMIFGAVACAVVFVFAQSVSIVPSGASGVIVTLGKVQDATLESGLNFKAPFVQKVVVIDNKIQRADVQGEASSKDLQIVNANVSVNYNVIGTKSSSLYKTVGKDWETILIRPAVQESVKAAFAKYTAEELITNRAEVTNLIKESLTEKVTPYGINIAEMNILNMGFTAEFNNAIEKKTTAEQEVKTEQQNLAKAKIIAEQKVVEAEAEAKSNKLIQESATDEVLMSKFIEKWDGKLPTVIGEGNMMDITSLMK